MRSLRYIDNATTLAFDRSRCVGCGVCLAVCPHGVFGAPDSGDRKVVLADRGGCMECGACARNCPSGAISVTPGVGCAQAIIHGWITGGPPDCGCDSGCC